MNKCSKVSKANHEKGLFAHSLHLFNTQMYFLRNLPVSDEEAYDAVSLADSLPVVEAASSSTWPPREMEMISGCLEAWLEGTRSTNGPQWS